MNVLSLFSGIGGLELGLERAGMTVVGQVEIDDYCRRVLAKHWPEVPRHDDVRTCVGWWQSEPRPRVDLVCGGFPCQPVSEAGRKLAQQDSRWLWPAMAEIVSQFVPQWVIGENVPGLLDHEIVGVVRDLEHLGYRSRVGTISACAVGAPHTRSRVFILAHTVRGGCRKGRDKPSGVRGNEAQPEARQGRLAQTERPDWWTREPRLARMAHGVPNRVDRNRALGNAVVPQVSERIGRLILAADAREAA